MAACGVVHCAASKYAARIWRGNQNAVGTRNNTISDIVRLALCWDFAVGAGEPWTTSIRVFVFFTPEMNCVFGMLMDVKYVQSYRDRCWVLWVIRIEL